MDDAVALEISMEGMKKQKASPVIGGFIQESEYFISGGTARLSAILISGNQFF